MSPISPHIVTDYMLRIKKLRSPQIFIFFLLFSHFVNAEVFKIGFVSGGTLEATRVQALIIKELSPLIEDSSNIEFVNFTALASSQSFQEKMDQASLDPEIKAVIAPGFLGSQFIFNQLTFSKPTFLAWVVDPNLLGGKQKNRTPNLYWLSTRNDLENTFRTIAQVIGQKPITLILDNATASLGSTFFQRLKSKAEKFGLDLSATFFDKSKPAAEQIESGTALVLAPPIDGSAEIIEQIQNSGTPVFTFEGPKAVEAGALMTDVVDANESLIARSIALDIYGLIQGETLEPGPRWLESEYHLCLNVASAQRMGIDLPIKFISSATIFGFTNVNVNSISLDNALQWVLDKNLVLAQSRNNIDIANESIIQAKSFSSPQFNTSLTHTRNRTNGNTVVSGSPDQNTLASVNYSQTLYSITDRTNHKIAKLDKESRQYLDDANRQNAVINTLNLFLQVLISESSLAAQEENLRLARSNLSMAQKRVKLGSGIAGDIYNFEASIATANSDLLAARIGTLEAKRSLMDLTNTEFDENVVFDDVDLNHPSIATSHQLVQPHIETLNGIQKLASWSSVQAVKESPALQATSIAIDSNRLQLKSVDKVRYTPEVKLVGQAFSYLDSSTGTSGANLDNLDDANLSVSLTLPLWTSGRNTSRVRESQKQLVNSELGYHADRNSAQVAARNAVYNLAQAWQDIKLGKIALSSAEKSFEINQRAYASGALTIEALQSIQNTYISALSADKANLYQYIQVLGNWQLQVAAVNYLMEPVSLQEWSENFQSQF